MRTSLERIVESREQLRIAHYPARGED